MCRSTRPSSMARSPTRLPPIATAGCRWRAARWRSAGGGGSRGMGGRCLWWGWVRWTGRGAGEILSLIRRCGLSPTKARNLKRLAETLVEEHGGKVPRDIKALERLPGVGHKTASVVMTQAFGEPAFPVDTHIHRLAARWKLSRAKNVEQTERDLKKLFPPEEWGRRHLQMIYFGREHCTARGHETKTCLICSFAA